MEYFYRVRFNNGNIKEFLPKELVDKRLPEFDLFSIKGNMDYYLDVVSKDIGLTKYDVKTINIVYRTKSKDIEYNLIKNNPYFDDVFKFMTKRSIKEYGKPEITRASISTESESYQEMRKWLFNQLKTNSSVFFEEIYKYPNKFREILERYVSTLNTYIDGEEDYHHQYDLESSIREALSIYKIYRNVASRRYSYEKYNRYQTTKKTVKQYIPTLEEIERKNKEMKAYYDSIDTNEVKVERYNIDNEEYLDASEYEEMAGSGKVL